VSTLKNDKDYKALEKDGALLSHRFSLTRVASNLICHAQVAKQAYLFWLF